MCLHRICVIGGAGSGKTVLTDNLSRVLNIPVYHLDGINYETNWVEVDKENKKKKILDIINNNELIIDGTYNGTLNERAKKADLIIFLDYSEQELKVYYHVILRINTKKEKKYRGVLKNLN